MKVKVLKLDEAAKEVEIQDGSTLQHVIQAPGFNREQIDRYVEQTSSIRYIAGSRWGCHYYEPAYQRGAKLIFLTTLDVLHLHQHL